MKSAALLFFATGIALFAQPDLVTQAPAIIAKCAPQYTESARRAGIEGTVVLYVRVYPDGKARGFKVQRSLSRDLDEKAIEAVRSWRFSPGKKDGKTVIVPATIEVNFRLADPSQPCREGLAQIEANPRNGRA